MTKKIPFSLVMPYHNNPGMLAKHYDVFRTWPEDIKRAVEVVICDDASDEPTFPYTYEYGAVVLPRVRRFRIPPPHVAWSHRVATNIAASEARGYWLLITDIDHVVPVETWRFLTDDGRPKLRTDVAYRFERVNADGSPYKPHPDSWLFHVSLWSQIQGYDERYRGHYGQNYPFIERVERVAHIEVLPTPLVRYSRDDIPDASERVLTRKSTEARAAIAQLRAKFRRDGTFFADTRGSAKYERVEP